MHLEFSRLRWPEWVVGLGGLVLALATFLLPWYTVVQATAPPGPKYFITQSVDGWHGVTIVRWLILLTILAALAVVFFQARERAPALPVAFTVMAAPLAALTVLWLIIRVWIAPHGGRGIGGWIGLLGAAAIAYGAYKSIRLEGIAAADGPSEIPTVHLGERASVGSGE
jgi:hypothetical protein